MSKFADQLLEFWTKIWMFLKPGLSLYGMISFFRSRLFLVLVIIVIALGLGRTFAKMKDLEIENRIKDQNIAALNDTVKTERTKSGQLEVAVAGYISSEKELKKLNLELFNEVIDQKGRVISLNKVVFQLKQDTAQLRSRINYLDSIMSQPVQVNDSTYSIGWKLEYDWDSTNFDKYEGETYVGIVGKRVLTYPKLTLLETDDKTYKYGFHNIFNDSFELRHYKTELTSRTTQVDMTFGQEILDDQLRVFVRTKYPGFTASSLQGWMIDPNKDPDIKKLMKMKKWIPNTWSIGVGPSVGYNLLSFEPYLGIGVSLNYNILQW